MRQRDIDEVISRALEHSVETIGGELGRANDEFVDFVDPAAFYRERMLPEEAAYISACFTEWVVFE